jgi:hypothetical protein
MKQLALRMRTLKPGIVLGYSGRLDAGLEAVYYNDLPFVWGRGGLKLFGRKEVEKQIQDFYISYMWTDDDLLGKIRAWFPRSSVVMSNPPFCVLDVSPNEDPVGSSPGASSAAAQAFNPQTAGWEESSGCGNHDRRSRSEAARGAAPPLPRRMRALRDASARTDEGDRWHRSGPDLTVPRRGCQITNVIQRRLADGQRNRGIELRLPTPPRNPYRNASPRMQRSHEPR